MKKIVIFILLFVSLVYANSMNDSVQATTKEDQFALGSQYEYGIGIAAGRVDYKEAAKWYRKAADQGDAWAQISLGDMYVTGRGVVKDLGTAKGLFRKACDNGEQEGCNKYKALNIREAAYYYYIGEKYDNYAKAKKTYDDYDDLKSAKKAFARACQDNYKDSCQREKDIDESMKYLGDSNTQKLKHRIKQLQTQGLSDLQITTILLKESSLYWAQMRYGKYGYEIQKKHKKSGIPEVYNKCMGCHGEKGNIKAFGKSKKINKLSKEDFVKAIKGYQNGTYGGSLKSIMIGQVKGLLPEDIESISKYLKLKSEKHYATKKIVHHEKSKVLVSSGGKITANKKSKYLEQIQAAIKADNKSEKKEKVKKAKQEKQRIAKKKQAKVKRKVGIFYDKATGLTWQDNKDVKTITRDWEAAKEYCKNLELGGYSDWRLPTKDELASIVDKTNTPTIKTGFKNVASYYYWDFSHPLIGKVSFFSGNTSYGYVEGSKYYVRCVVNKIHWWE